MTISDRASGFTLLEMLVVMLIAGMALMLTTQALGQYRRAHSSAILSERTGREFRLSEAWFRESIRGLHPAGAPADGSADARFAGTPEQCSGITLAPVLAGQGVPVAQTWRIASDGAGNPRLELEEDGKSLVLSLPRASRMLLHYMDSRGVLHDRWPPRLGQWKELPDAVLLELVPEPDGSGGGLIGSAIAGPLDPLGHLDSAYEYDPL